MKCVKKLVWKSKKYAFNEEQTIKTSIVIYSQLENYPFVVKCAHLSTYFMQFSLNSNMLSHSKKRP